MMLSSFDYMSYSSDEDDGECCLKGLLFYTRDSMFPRRTIPKEMFKPPPPTYYIDTNSVGKEYMIFNDKYIGTIYECWKNNIECSIVTNCRGNKIVCMYFKPVPDANCTVFYSHGNCADIGSDIAFCLRLGLLLDCNLFAYDYSGYGASAGEPSQKNLLVDVQCAWEHLRTQYGVPEDRIILYGRGMGTVPTVELASKKKPAAVILLSPLTSANNVAIPVTKRSRNQQQFYAFDKISKVTSPILVIHGVNDRVINLSHSVSIYNKYPKRIDPLWIQGAGHDDIQFNLVYLKGLRKFVTEELGLSHTNENIETKLDHLRKMNLYI